MLKNTKIRIEESEGYCSFFDLYSGERLEQIRVREDLDRVLSYLKKINQLKNEDGRHIYEVHTVFGVSAWSFHQGWLFWENLRHFVFYEEVIKTLKEKKYTVFLSKKEKPNLVDVLHYGGVPIEGDVILNTKNIFWRVKTSVVEKILGIIACAFGYMSLFYFRLSNRKILVYSPDKYNTKAKSDFRMERIYKLFRDQSIPIAEVFHTLLGREFIRNLLLRKRAAFYLECLPLSVSDSTLNAIELKPVISGFDFYQEDYVRNLVNRMDILSKKSISKVLTLKRIISFIKINKLVTIDDMRSAQEVVLACRSLGIRSYAFQHGHINEYHTGHMNYGIPNEMSVSFDVLYVWNEYWKQKLITHSTMYNNQNVQVGGYLRPPKEVEIKLKFLPKKPDELSVLISNDTWAPREEVKQYLEKLIKMGCTLYLSVRPDLSIEKQIRDFGISNNPNIHISLGSEALLLGKVHCVAGVYSTFIYEMLYYGIPAFVFETSFSFGKDLVNDDLAHQLSPNFTFDEIKDYLEISKSKKELLWPRLDTSIEDILENILK